MAIFAQDYWSLSLNNRSSYGEVGSSNPGGSQAYFLQGLENYPWMLDEAWDIASLWNVFQQSMSNMSR